MDTTSPCVHFSAAETRRLCAEGPPGTSDHGRRAPLRGPRWSAGIKAPCVLLVRSRTARAHARDGQRNPRLRRGCAPRGLDLPAQSLRLLLKIPKIPEDPFNHYVHYTQPPLTRDAFANWYCDCHKLYEQPPAAVGGAGGSIQTLWTPPTTTDLPRAKIAPPAKWRLRLPRRSWQIHELLEVVRRRLLVGGVGVCSAEESAALLRVRRAVLL